MMVRAHKKLNVIFKSTKGEMSQNIEKNSEPTIGQRKKCRLLHVINIIPISARSKIQKTLPQIANLLIHFS